ncbi:MAG: type II secretion system F family protein [Deltaproteobacteria bacterium]|nr:MAG: type II secretion system F family protein [Deltaproteobacteria bacterium]
MPVYVWEGKTLQGVKKKGEMEAPDELSIRNYLRQQRIIPSKIKKKAKEIEISIPFLKRKTSKKTIAIFTRELSTMINAGLPLIQALEILQNQQEDKNFREVIKKIKEDVEGGSTFAGALKKHPNEFDELFVNLIIAGEEGGLLDTILNRLATYIEKVEALKKKIKSALVYPAIIVSVAVIVVAVLMIFVIPVFDEMFREAGQELPAFTKLVVNLSKFFKGNILFIGIVLIIIVILFRRFYKTEKGRMMIDSLLLKLPVFGILFKKVAVARFTRTLGTLISSGVPILDGLNIVAKTAGNKTIETAIINARSNIAEGQTIADPLERSGVFPLMVTQMIAVGESTGALDAMLQKIADFYEEEVDVAVGTLTSLLEPFLMVFLGVVVGGIVVAMYLPIFKMAGAVGG